MLSILKKLTKVDATNTINAISIDNIIVFIVQNAVTTLKNSHTSYTTATLPKVCFNI